MARFVVRFIQSPRAACLSVLPPRALAICRKALINSNLRAELQDSPSFEARFLSCRINCQSGRWRPQGKSSYTDSFTGGYAASSGGCATPSVRREYSLSLAQDSIVLAHLYSFNVE